MDEALEKFLRVQMEEYLEYLPEHMHGAVERYLFHRIEPGSFLCAVLENNLKEAVARADSINRAALSDIVIFITNGLPSVCHGNPTKVAAWLAGES